MDSLCEYGCEPVVEVWRPVVGFPSYEVSNLGRARSVDRVIETVNGRMCRYRGQLLAPIEDPDGYRQAAVARPGRRRTVRVHVLMMEAFVGPRPEGMEVCHADDVKAHNCLTNLKYGTRSDNQRDAVRNRVHVNSKKDCCPNAHPLVVPNLVPSQIPVRACLSCNRARSCMKEARKRGADLSGQYKAIADRYFAEIFTESLKTYVAGRVILSRFLPTATESAEIAA